MKAITISENGGIENLIFSELPTPTIGPKEVLVAVKAIGINPVDAFVRLYPDALRNYVKPVEGKPVILGWDISGNVVAVGNDASQFNIGDQVFGMVNFPGQGSAYAEYVAAPAAHLALKPANISHKEAAAASLAAITAWQALVTYAKLQKDEKILIHAAAGGVGHYAVQLAKHLGAYVIGTGSAGKKDFILGLGVDEFIDYQAEKFEDKVQDADVVLDSLFGDHVFRSVDAARIGGRVISLLTYFTDEKLIQKVKDKNLYVHRVSVTSAGEDVAELAKLLADGSIRSHISQTFSFADLPKAHAEIAKGSTVGKIVVAV
ncbi:MAG: NADP-dependent oxidoreductase [Dyadobacter sp.]|uniref:NADP-dependent oxidoreductase n=1 Tax=Dyadobacter sp. TaxID=1914288 RepID=UPI0032640E3C